MKETIRPEFEQFYERLKARSIPVSEPVQEAAGGYFYSTETSPFFTLCRAVQEEKPQAVFSLRDLPMLKKASDKKLADIGVPIVRLNDDHSKLIFIVMES